MELKNSKKLKVMKKLGAFTVAAGVTMGGISIGHAIDKSAKRDEAYDDCVDIVEKVKQTESFKEYFGYVYQVLDDAVDKGVITSEDLYNKLNETLTVEHIYENRDKIFDSDKDSVETKEKLEDSYTEYLKYKYKNGDLVGLAGMLLGVGFVGYGVSIISDARTEEKLHEIVDREL